MTDDDPELSLREAADLLGVHYMTAYRYVRSGRLPARHQGNHWTVRARDVRELRFTPAFRDLHDAISDALVAQANVP